MFKDADGNQATIHSDGPRLYHIAADGTETMIRTNPYHTAAFGETVDLNPDGILHTTGVLKADAGTITLGFEDLYNGGDRDFDDSVFTVDIGVQNALVLNAHYQQDDSGTDPDPSHEGVGSQLSKSNGLTMTSLSAATVPTSCTAGLATTICPATMAMTICMAGPGTIT
jgi:serralysin